MPINSIEEGCQLRKLWVALQTDILVEIFKAILYYTIFAKCENHHAHRVPDEQWSFCLACLKEQQQLSRLSHLLRDSVG